MKELKEIINEEFGKEFAVFLGSGYPKIFMERVYDKAFENKIVKKLTELGVGTKHATIIALAIGMFLINRKMPDNTFLKKVAKEIQADAWPEIARRILNGIGQHAFEPEEKEAIQEILKTNLSSKSDSSKSIQVITERIKNLRKKINPEKGG